MVNRTASRPDPVQQVGQRDVGAGALGHAHGLAVAQHVHDLAEHDLEPDVGIAGQRFDRRLHARDVAAMVGAPDVDHQLGAARHLVGVVGDVVGEVGVGAVRLAQRAIDVVAEPRRAEQGLLARFPIVGRLALGRLEHALIDQPVGPQPFDGAVRLAPLEQLALAGEHVEADAEGGQVLPDARHHRGGRELAHGLEPLRRVGDGGARAGQAVAELVAAAPRRPGPGIRPYTAGRWGWPRRTPPRSGWCRAPAGSASRRPRRGRRPGRRRR